MPLAARMTGSRRRRSRVRVAYLPCLPACMPAYQPACVADGGVWVFVRACACDGVRPALVLHSSTRPCRPSLAEKLVAQAKPAPLKGKAAAAQAAAAKAAAAAKEKEEDAAGSEDDGEQEAPEQGA
jgi:hypothetical protein